MNSLAGSGMQRIREINETSIWIMDAHGYRKRFIVRADEKVNPPRRPDWFSGTARRALRLSNSQTQGLIQIRAELGLPTAYPAPGSKVTTTLYA